MDNKEVKFDFSGKTNEEILTMFFHEIRSPVAIVAGHLSMLNMSASSEDDTRRFIETALRGILFIQENVNQVFQYLDSQRKDA